MYIAMCDEFGHELPLGRRSLFEVTFKVSPPTRDSDVYTIINGEMIIFGKNLTDRVLWAACIGVYLEADAPPHVICPLNHGRALKYEDAIAIAPGQLAIGINSIKPWDPDREPEPRPKWLDGADPRSKVIAR